jgi:translation initiation factor 4A
MPTFIEESTEITKTVEENKLPAVSIETWDGFDLKTDLLRGIYSYGFENPSPIQQKAILPIIKGRDLLAQAQSGSGKTGTFAIGILQKLDTAIKATQAIVIAPTHELSNQISQVIIALGNMMEGLVVKTLYGGVSVNQDANDLRTNVPHIIVGCSGRIYDMMKRGHIQMDDVKLFVLDEADEMLSRGFKDQIYNIFQYLKSDVQVALFSATMPDDMIELTKRFLRNPECITIEPAKLNLECINQYFVALPNDNAKYDTIKDLFSRLSVGQCIIYANSVHRVIHLYNAMTSEGFSVCCIHSEMTKSERDQAITIFRKGDYRVLISSNITARGIDIQQVSTVINFDIPKCVHAYLHRIGRSGRWGRKGTAINFITRQDVHTLKTIESHYQSNIKELPANFSA